MDKLEIDVLKRDICEGVARIEDLPDIAFDDQGIPLKIIPRTPTESVLWVKKPFSNFFLNPVHGKETAKGLEILHTHLELIYRYQDGGKEQLLLGAELFHILLELKDGFQLSDAASEDTFANLSIFTQRLAQENSRELYAWNPIKDDEVFEISAKLFDGVQQFFCEPVIKRT